MLEATPGRPSVVVRKREARGRTLMLCAHLDTVGVEGMTDPHAPRIDGDRLYGRGAYDMKSGLAAALIACREAEGDVLVAAVADEEHASLGVQEVLAAHTADAAIVTEPTERELIVAHKGFVWIELEIEGRAAHGSRYEEGVDAIVKAGPVLTAIGELDTQLAEHSHPLLGRGSVHASLIEGGAELSSYPARCTIGLERRTLPGETAAQVEAEIAALGRGAKQRTLLVREPFEVDPEAEIVRGGGGGRGRPGARRRALLGRRRLHRRRRHPDRDVRRERGRRARRRGVGERRRHDRGHRDADRRGATNVRLAAAVMTTLSR